MSPNVLKLSLATPLILIKCSLNMWTKCSKLARAKSGYLTQEFVK